MAKKNKIFVKGAREHNLKNVDVEIPRDKFVVITGLSGSGKSSLVIDTLYPYLSKSLFGSRAVPHHVKCITGIEHIDKVINVDQSPIGRTPRPTRRPIPGCLPISGIFLLSCQMPG